MNIINQKIYQINDNQMNADQIDYEIHDENIFYDECIKNDIISNDQFFILYRIIHHLTEMLNSNECKLNIFYINKYNKIEKIMLKTYDLILQRKILITKYFNVLKNNKSDYVNLIDYVKKIKHFETKINKLYEKIIKNIFGFYFYKLDKNQCLTILFLTVNDERILLKKSYKIPLLCKICFLIYQKHAERNNINLYLGYDHLNDIIKPSCFFDINYNLEIECEFNKENHYSYSFN